MSGRAMQQGGHQRHSSQFLGVLLWCVQVGQVVLQGLVVPLVGHPLVGHPYLVVALPCQAETRPCRPGAVPFLVLLLLDNQVEHPFLAGPFLAEAFLAADPYLAGPCPFLVGPCLHLQSLGQVAAVALAGNSLGVVGPYQADPYLSVPYQAAPYLVAPCLGLAYQVA